MWLSASAVGDLAHMPNLEKLQGKVRDIIRYASMLIYENSHLVKTPRPISLPR